MSLKPIKIKSVTAREILDSRGQPTIEVSIETSGGSLVSSSVPAGRSKGRHEAVELRDGDKRRYRGLGVFNAVHNVTSIISPKIKNKTISSLPALDKILLSLDSSKEKKKLGANALLGVSMAGAKAFASENKLPLYRYLNSAYALPKIKEMPTPMMNIFNGGRHADTNLDIQELMVIPKRKKLLSERIRMGVEIFYALADVLKTSGYDTDTGDEGGYSPDIHATTEAIRMIMLAIKDAGYIAGKEVFLAFDVGASTLYDERMKQYRFKLDASFYTTRQMITLYEVWRDEFPLLVLEDGLFEDDWESWTLLTEHLGKDMLIVGDDLFVSQKERLLRGIKSKAANAILIKPNQVGTITETMETIKLAHEHKMAVIISHRSGETNDDAIADLSVAAQAQYVKFGAPNRGERVSKYNRLTAIEEEVMHHEE